MRIALIGYGKMGQMIERIAAQRGHQVVLRLTRDNLQDFVRENIINADVAIEFTAPESAFENVNRCLDFGIPVISGSTGWNENLPAAKAHCEKAGGTFLHASNFSVGVNIFFEVNKLLARLMKSQPHYEVSIREVHHTAKKDAPSGTAVTLAEQILAQSANKKSWISSLGLPEQLSIISERIDPAPGTHYVNYNSAVDSIELVHTAHSREGFALGAVIAAEFIKDKKGVFTMSDVLQLTD
jgi:4-hydroxy-tetrahydrodipicolinate reductase